MANIFVTIADKTVSSAGTAEQITSSNIITPSVTLQALPGNTGNVYIGDSDVASGRCVVELTPGDVFTFEGEDRAGKGRDEINMSDIYIDAANSSDGVHIGYVARKAGNII